MAALRSANAFRSISSSTSVTALRLPAVTVPVRRLHMTGSNAQSPFLAFESAVSELPKSERKPASRQFNTSRTLKANKDSSTMDFAYMPSLSSSMEADNEIRIIPLLPDNFYPERPTSQAVVETEPVVMPQISVTSLGSDVAAVGESEGGKSADGLGLAKEVEKEAGMIKEIWKGFVDDLLGVRKVVA